MASSDSNLANVVAASAKYIDHDSLIKRIELEKELSLGGKAAEHSDFEESSAFLRACLNVKAIACNLGNFVG